MKEALIAIAAFLVPFAMAALMCWLCPVHDPRLRKGWQNPRTKTDIDSRKNSPHTGLK